MAEYPLIILTKHARERTLHRFSKGIQATVENVTLDFKDALENNKDCDENVRAKRIDGRVFTFIYEKDGPKFVIITFYPRKY